ncbi:leucine-rich repeat domain-containing protein [Pseudoalteromonas luteoviolacea]|uniref:leucine-rich repeat domain-containing protein n=1 Tax=Pseudoalteromonas luteoviolacea TaxID=43657 RepID=UPI001B37808E|nr:hypothetical protein [Pseudoalteromonas luteoviolacea]MBQ4837014.1 hypothetical protein [Pseudoalteromonas luteoviolacea]
MKNYLIVLLAAALAACGGGGGSDSPSTPSTANQGTDNKADPVEVTAQLDSSYVELQTYKVTYSVLGDEKGMSELTASVSIPEIAYFEQVSVDTAGKVLSFSIPELVHDSDASLSVSWVTGESGSKVQRSLDLPFIAKDNGLKLSEMFKIKDTALASCVDNYLYSSDVIELHCSNVTSLEGIENVVELTSLYLGNSELTGGIKLLGPEKLKHFEVSNDTAIPVGTLDLSMVPKLDTVKLSNIDLSELILADNTLLMDIKISGGKLKSVDLSKASHIQVVVLKLSSLTELILPDSSPLKYLGVPGCILTQGCEGWLTALDLKNNNELQAIHLPEQKLKTIDLSKQGKLKTIDLKNAPLEHIDFSSNKKIESINIGALYDRPVEVSGLTNKPNLVYLDASHSQLTSIDLTGTHNIEIIHLNNNFLTELSLSHLVKLEKLKVDDNKISEIDLSKNTELTALWASNNKISEIDLSKNTELTTLGASNNKISQLDLSAQVDSLHRISLNSNPLVALRVNENNKITNLDLSETSLTEFQGSNFKALVSLSISGGRIESLDFSQAPDLRDIRANDIGLKTINLSNNKNLEAVYLQLNELVELDLSGADRLEIVDVLFNQIASLKFGNVSSIIEINAVLNQLSTIDLNGADNLEKLSLGNNNLQSWNTQLPDITYLDLSYNSITSYSTGISEFLEHVNLSGNDISSLEITGAHYLKELYIDKNPLLELNIDTQSQQALEVLNLSNSKLTSLAQFNAPRLVRLGAKNSNVRSVNLHNFPSVESIELSNTQLSSIEIPASNQIKSIDIDGTFVTQVDFKNLSNLDYFYGRSSFMNDVTNIDGVNNKEAYIFLYDSPLSLDTRAYLTEMVAQGYTNISY